MKPSRTRRARCATTWRTVTDGRDPWNERPAGRSWIGVAGLMALTAAIWAPAQALAHTGKTDPFASVEVVEGQADRSSSPVVILVAPRGAADFLAGGSGSVESSAAAIRPRVARRLPVASRGIQFLRLEAGRAEAALDGEVEGESYAGLTRAIDTNGGTSSIELIWFYDEATLAALTANEKALVRSLYASGTAVVIVAGGPEALAKLLALEQGAEPSSTRRRMFAFVHTPAGGHSFRAIDLSGSEEFADVLRDAAGFVTSARGAGGDAAGAVAGASRLERPASVDVGTAWGLCSSAQLTGTIEGGEYAILHAIYRLDDSEDDEYDYYLVELDQTSSIEDYFAGSTSCGHYMNEMSLDLDFSVSDDQSLWEYSPDSTDGTSSISDSIGGTLTTSQLEVNASVSNTYTLNDVTIAAEVAFTEPSASWTTSFTGVSFPCCWTYDQPATAAQGAQTVSVTAIIQAEKDAGFEFTFGGTFVSRELEITDSFLYTYEYTDFTTDTGTWTLHVSSDNACDDSN